MISIEQTISNELTKNVKLYALGAIRELSTHYDFDYNDAVTYLKLDEQKPKKQEDEQKPKKQEDEQKPKKQEDVKPKKQGKSKKQKKPDVELPFCGVKMPGFCSAIKKSQGLYNQCTKVTNNPYCTICQKQAEKNTETGKPNLGDINDRIEQGDEWKDASGKKPVKYVKVMDKLKITKEDAIKVAETYNITIPESEFVIDQPKKKPAKKTVNKNVKNDDKVEEKDENKVDDKEKNKRGRPVKDKVNEETTPGDDLIATLIAEAKQDEEDDSTQTKDVEVPTKDVEVPTKEEKEIPVVENNEDSELEEEEATEVEVVKKTINGKPYLVDNNNLVYDDDENEIGMYDEKENKINYFEVKEEEE
jgi:hypothetical protein